MPTPDPKEVATATHYADRATDGGDLLRAGFWSAVRERVEGGATLRDALLREAGRRGRDAPPNAGVADRA